MRGKTGNLGKVEGNTVTFYATARSKRGQMRLKGVEAGLTGLGCAVRGNLRRSGEVRE